MQVTDEILDAKAVGQMLHIHARTVMRLASQGEIPGFRVGDRWRFRRAAIDEYIRKQEQQAGEQKEQREP